MKRLLLIPLVVVGCATRVIEVPVTSKAVPPADLVEPFVPKERPRFIYPNDADASSCLTPEGERQLREMILDLMSRYEALRAWSTE